MKLEIGTAFPGISAKNADGEDVVVGDLVSGGWGVVLFYRGHW